jgi:CoA:oxalate CoA-transferase
VATANGDRVCLVGNPSRRFSDWLRALGDDPSRYPAAIEEDAARDALVESATRFGTADELVGAVRAAGLAAAPIRPFTDLASSEWAEYRGLLAEGAPGVRVPAAPWRSSSGDIGVRRTAATLGAHTAEVLSEFLGLGADDLARLRAAGAIAGG